MHWLPNGKLCIYGLEAQLYEGRLHIEALRAQATWRSVLRRSPRLRELEVYSTLR